MKTTQAEATEAGSIVNGMDLDVLGGTVAAVAENPELGRSHFRAINRWENGSVNHTTVDGFFTAGAEQNHAQPYVMSADEPPMLSGSDVAPNPVEHLLHALASCITTSIVAHAAVKEITIGRLEAEVEGDIDLNGFLGLNPETPKGYTEIRVRYRIEASESDFPRLQALAKFSPVYNTLRGGTNVTLAFERI
jgi:uncharacterized OsmC-like protein